MVGAFLAGWQSRAMWSHMAVARQQAAVVETVERQGAASHQVDEAHLEAQERVRTVTRTLIKEVPVYVPQDAVDRCDVNVGAVRLLNAAAAGVPPVPDPAGVDHAAPAGVGLDTLVAVTAGNYGVAHEWGAQLDACQAWIREQQAVRQ